MDEDRPTGGDGAGDALKQDRARGAEIPAGAPLPAQMRERLDQCAAAWGKGDVEELLATGQRTAGLRRRSAAGWTLATIFCALAVWGWWPRFATGPDSAPAALDILTPTPELAREQLLHSDPHLGRWPWVSETGAASGVRGDVVWDGVHQRGYLWLEGLPPTAGTHQQYQLWIFDANRDDRYPVDGGVFDVAAAAHHVVVPFHAARYVTRPVAFAVTVERSGGVVVSSREKVVALARATDS